MSGEYRERCLLHVVRILGSWTPGASRLTPRSWAAVEKTEQVLRETWMDRAPDYLELELNRFWSAAMFVSYQKVESITADPLDFMIEEWHPHVRAAAAWRMLELEGDQTRSLGEWQARLEEALQALEAALYLYLSRKSTLPDYGSIAVEFAPSWAAKRPVRKRPWYRGPGRRGSRSNEETLGDHEHLNPDGNAWIANSTPNSFHRAEAASGSVDGLSTRSGYTL